MTVITHRTYRLVPGLDREVAVAHAIKWAGWGPDRTLADGTLERTEVGEAIVEEDGGWTVTVYLVREAPDRA